MDQMATTALFVPGSAGEAFGTVLHTRRAGDFLFRESRYRRGLTTPAHYHPHAYLCYVAEGALAERDTRGEVSYPAGTLHFHPAGHAHSVANPDCGFTSVSIIPLGADAQPLESSMSPRVSSAPRSSLIAARCRSELHVCDLASDLALEELALELVASLTRVRAPRERRTPAWVLTVRDLLHERFREPLPLAELAAHANVHPVHLVRAFRRHAGVTPAEYQRRLRIESARHALVTTRIPLATLALEAGFSSQAHFTSMFHRMVRMTPAAWRRAHSR
jgi:AraC family transcriptional regulator